MDRESYLFCLWVADTKILKDAFTAISTIVDEATFNISAEGISLRAMDLSRVVMVDFVMRKASFEEYMSSEKYYDTWLQTPSLMTKNSVA